jgi:hypothetical protein
VISKLLFEYFHTMTTKRGWQQLVSTFQIQSTYFLSSPQTCSAPGFHFEIPILLGAMTTDSTSDDCSAVVDHIKLYAHLHAGSRGIQWNYVNQDGSSDETSVAETDKHVPFQFILVSEGIRRWRNKVLEHKYCLHGLCARKIFSQRANTWKTELKLLSNLMKQKGYGNKNICLIWNNFLKFYMKTIYNFLVYLAWFSQNIVTKNSVHSGILVL